MTKVYGCSDDLVEIEYSNGGGDEIGCYNRNVRIWFKDGTVILVGYSKPGLGVWWIRVEKQGNAQQKLTVCDDEDAEIYSDIFEIDASVIGWNVPKKVCPMCGRKIEDGDDE